MSKPLTEVIRHGSTREQEREEMREKKMHIDEFLDMPSFAMDEHLEYPHFMFTHWRKPALEKCIHDRYMRNFKLFVDYQGSDGNWATYRVVGASRLGDVWLTPDFSTDTYNSRVDLILNRFRNWRNVADWALSFEERMLLAKAAGIPTVADEGTSAARRRAAQFTENWMRSNKIPERFLGASPEQREKLLALRSKRIREE